jgi:hypothetical protein
MAEATSLMAKTSSRLDSAAMRARSGLTTRQLLVAVLFVAIFAMAVRQPTDTDTWWHLKSGQLMWENGHLLRTDPFSHTVAGAPILYPALFQGFLWPIYRALGLAGLALLLAGMIVASFALIYRQCDGRPYVAALAVLLAAIASSVVWAVRPHLVSLLLAAVLTYLLDRYRQNANSRWLWPIPLLVVLWVNSHGGFVIAFLLIGCHLVGEALNRFTLASPALPRLSLKPLLVVFLLSIPAVLVNPNTFKMFPYALQTVSIGPLQDFIQEWAAPDFHNIQFQPFIWLLLLTIGAIGLSRRRADWTDLALVCLFAYMSLLAVRNIALFALVAPPILTRHAVPALDDLATANPRLSWLAALTHTLSPPRPRRPQTLLNILLLILVVIGAGVKVGLDLARVEDPDVWGQGLPLEAVEYLRDRDLPGEMFNSYNWGGYLIWSLYPDKPVFVDGRTDLYALNSRVLEDYSQVHWIRPGWPQVLDNYDIGYVITERTGLLDMMLAETEGWQPVHDDDLAVVYVRAKAAP